jgi:hypothetical protein
VLTGATRCIKRMGLLRGDKVEMRYRRLDMECTRTKTEASIAISRARTSSAAARRPVRLLFRFMRASRSRCDGIDRDARDPRSD